jgi:hypothetical protein
MAGPLYGLQRLKPAECPGLSRISVVVRRGYEGGI